MFPTDGIWLSFGDCVEFNTPVTEMPRSLLQKNQITRLGKFRFAVQHCLRGFLKMFNEQEDKEEHKEEKESKESAAPNSEDWSLGVAIPRITS